MNEDSKGYPPFQWSIFPDGNRGEQYVVRAETVQDLETHIAEVKAVIGKQAPAHSQLPAGDQRAINDVMSKPSEDTALKCEKCGAAAVHKEGISKKTGKPWSAIFCSTDDKSHAKFL